MRRLGYVLLAIVLLIIIAALVAPAFIDANQFRGRVQAELEKRLNRPLTLGAMHLKLLPPSFRVENVTIGEDKNFGTDRPFAKVTDLYASASLIPLLRKEVEIQALELQNPVIELVRDPQGNWNFASIGHKQQVAAKQPGSFSLALLKITDGQVAVTDNQKHLPRAVYDHIDVAIKNFEPNKPFSFMAAAHLPGSGHQTFELDGDAGPIQQANLIDTPFHGKLKFDQVSISSLEDFLNSKALEGTDATITGMAHVSNQNGVLASDGQLKLDNARIHGTDVGYPINTEYKASFELANDLVKIDQGTINLGKTPLSLTGSVDAKATPARLDLHVTARDASIAELARLAAAAGVAFNPATKVDGHITADITAQGPSSQPTLNGQLQAHDVNITGKDLPKPVQVTSIELALTPQTIRSNDFAIHTGGTTLNGRLTLNNYTSTSPNIDLNLNTADASLGEVLNIAQAYGVKAVDGMSGSGSLNLAVHAVGPIKNMDAMTYDGNGRLQNAFIKSPDLTKPLQVKNAELRFTQNSMMVQNLAASLGETNATGQMTLRNFAAPQVQFTLSADKVNIGELQQITSPTPPAKRAGMTTSNVVYAATPAKSQPSMLSNITGNGTVNIGHVVHDQLALDNVHSDVILDRGIVRLSPLNAQIYNGQETGSIVLDTRTTPPTVQVSSTLQRVDANQLISSMSSLKQTLYGLLTGNAHTSFAIPAKAEDIARSLNGNVSLDLVNGRIAHMDLLNALGNIGRFATGRSQQVEPFTNIVKLSGSFNLTNGVASTDNLKAMIDGGSLAAVGTANLVDESLNLHLTAVLSRGLSQSVGGTSIGGFMNTALANNQGELVLPVIVTGTFSHPSFAPDVEKIAQMKLQNLVPSFNNPAALSSGILGAVLGNGANGRGGEQQGLQGIVGALTGQQQQQQQQQNQQGQMPQSDQQQQQNQNPLGDLVQGLIGGGQKKKQQQQQQQQQPKKPEQPPQ